MHFDTIIPALNEEETIGDVVRMAYGQGAHRVVVVDNHSTDGTGQRAEEAGAVVVLEPQIGYGRACLTGIEALASDPPEWVLFCDGDGADDKKESLELEESVRIDLLVQSLRVTESKLITSSAYLYHQHLQGQA